MTSQEEYIVKILEIKQITHDTKSFTTTKPPNYKFTPGQATELSINTPELKNEKRPFTFTSLNEDPNLEFVIKQYPEHNGVTKALHQLKVNDTIIIRDIWGAINYKGPGVFFAGGAGITPFIAILRQLNKDAQLRGNTLIFSNKTEKDIILKPEFDQMQNLKKIYTLSRENNPKYLNKRINVEFLKSHISNFNQHFYICGPTPMVGELQHVLRQLGANPESIVIET